MNTRRKLTGIICILAAAAIMSCTLTACGSKNSDTAQEGGSSASDSAVPGSSGTDELVKIEYTSKEIKLPEGVNYVDTVQAVGDKLYFVYSEYNYDENTGISNNKFNLYCIDHDGNVISKREIPIEKKDENDNAYINTNGYRVLEDGSIWYVESHDNSAQYNSEGIDDGMLYSEVETSAAGADAPAEEGEEEAAAETTSETTEVPSSDGSELSWTNEKYYIHADSDGNIISKIDLNAVPEIKEADYLNYVVADNSGNIIAVINNMALVLDPEGNKLFSVQFEGDDTWAYGAFTGNDGKVYINLYESSMNEDGSYIGGQVLRAIDMEGKKLSDGIKIPPNINNVIGGSGDHIAYYSSSSSIYGLNADGTSEELINCINAGIDASDYYNFIVCEDKIFIPSYDSEGKCFISMISKLDAADVKEKIKVDMAVYYLDDSLRPAIVQFNKTNPDYQICITDYSSFNDYSTGKEEDYNAGLTKLNAEITAGNIPDLISVNDSMDTMGNYASKGLLIDLNPYIDGEDGINRDEYYDSIWRGNEVDGKLYSVVSSFYITGFAAKQKYVPEDGPISFDEAKQIADSNGMSMINGAYLTRSDFIQSAVLYGYNSFVNESDNTCSFNSEEFVKILEMSKDYPEEMNMEEMNQDPDFWTNYEMAYRNDKALLGSVYFSNFADINYTEAGQFGEKISITGFPGTGDGAVIMPSSGTVSITKNAAHPEAGWQLIKMLLSDENQEKAKWNFPVKKSALDKMAEEAMKPNTYKDENGNDVEVDNSYMIGDMEVNIGNVTQEQVDHIKKIIDGNTNVINTNSATDIMNIINEETASFYSGQNTAQQAADMIQSRVQIFLSEQS